MNDLVDGCEVVGEQAIHLITLSEKFKALCMEGYRHNSFTLLTYILEHVENSLLHPVWSGPEFLT